MGKKRGAYGVWRENLRERGHSSDLCVNRRKIEKQTVKKSAAVERRGLD
jgi:hypothetical protein